MAGIIEWGIGIVLGIITALSYPGIILLMALESACIPIPSEVVMPLAGSLIHKGTFDLIGLTIAGTIGNLIGSITVYWIGMKYGRSFIAKYGRYVLLREKHVDLAESWFKRYGDAATFFSRMLPVIRTFISLPAGMARMNFKKFVALTTAGSIPWNFALAYIGFLLQENWESILAWFSVFDIIIVIALIVLLAFLIRRYLRGKRTSEKKSPSA
jgi:membrane protein DedA with SNARE-associated domain